MMDSPLWTFRQIEGSRRGLRDADRYARWEYGMADATPLLTIVDHAEFAGGFSPPREGPAETRRPSRLGLLPLRFLAVLMAPRHR